MALSDILSMCVIPVKMKTQRMKQNIQFWLTTKAFLCSLLTISPSQAQILPDATLPNNSNIIYRGNTSIITGGTKAGSNLFHSFREFSVLTNGVVYFNNALDVQNIISRVTGSSISNIDGLIKANGAANLFLINPNGIIFGPNARLNIGGSFVGSTASSLKFADGNQFSATANHTTPLLTISVPIGLQFENNSGAIRLEGIGHDVSAADYEPIMRGNSSTRGLQVQSGKTLALVGGDVNLSGGILTAEGGRVELGSVDKGVVSINTDAHDLSLGYENVPAFKDINLSQRSLIDVSGIGSASVQIQGRRLQISDASLVLSQNQGTLPTGTLKVNASDSLQIQGSDPSRRLVSGIWSETLGLANGGEISISAPQLKIQSSGQIFSSTFGAAKAGDISLIVPKYLQLIGPLPNETPGGVIVSSLSQGSGNSGGITVFSRQMNIANGGAMVTANVVPSTSSIVSGNSGNITINAIDSVDVHGTASNSSSISPSAISAAIFSSSGQAGNVTINTSRLRVRDGGRVDSSTAAFGTAGSVIINAKNSVDVSSVAFGNNSPSLVTSAAVVLNQSLQNLLKLPNNPSGGSGKVFINTNQLNITNGAQVSVENDGPRDAGNLQLEAKSINLNNSGSIKATTASGNGGDILLQSNNLQLRRNSSISTDATRGTGKGGNITINTGTLAALESSPITANAVRGNGGNIQINAQGIFRSPDSPITASSQLGINGTVQINVPYIDFARAAANPVTPPQTPQVGSVCSGHSGSEPSSLVVVGTGGAPPSPSESLMNNPGWHDNSIPPQATENSPTPQLTVEHPVAIIEAQGWIRRPNGIISLVADPSGGTPYSSLSAPPCHQAAGR